MLTVRLDVDDGRSARRRRGQEPVEERLKALGPLRSRRPVAREGRAGEKHRAGEQRGSSRATAKDNRNHVEKPAFARKDADSLSQFRLQRAFRDVFAAAQDAGNVAGVALGASALATPALTAA